MRRVSDVPQIHEGAVRHESKASGPLWQQVTPDFEAAFMAIEHVEERLRKFTRALDVAGVPYAIIGGNAVAAWVSTVDPDATRTTKDVDVLLRREDLQRAARAVDDIDMELAEVAGVPMFMDRDNPSPKRAVHVILAEERVREHQPRPAPGIDAAVQSPQGFRVINLPELVRMKLEANRRHDQVHIEDLLRVGLIDAELASGLPGDLLERLRYIRDTMEWFTEPPKF
jgi:hypothetical protein